MCRKWIYTNLPGILSKSTGTPELTHFCLVKPFLKHQFNLTCELLPLKVKLSLRKRNKYINMYPCWQLGDRGGVGGGNTAEIHHLSSKNWIYLAKRGKNVFCTVSVSTSRDITDLSTQWAHTSARHCGYRGTNHLLNSFKCRISVPKVFQWHFYKYKSICMYRLEKKN